MYAGITIVLLFLIFSPQLIAQPETNELLAVEFYQNGEFDKAAVLFEELYEKSPTPFYYDYYFNCLIELKEYKKAEKFIAKLLKKSPENPAYNVDLGYVYIKSDEKDKANKHYESLIKGIIPERTYIVNLSNAFLLRGLNEYAIKTLEHGQKLMKGYDHFTFELAEIYLKNNDFTSALTKYLDLISEYSNYAETIRMKLQDILASDPDGSKNEIFKTSLSQRIKKQPDNPVFPEMLLWYFIQQKEFASALIQAKSLDKRYAEDGSRIINLARVALSNQYFDEAIECYDYIIDKKGPFSAYYQTARIEKLNARYRKITSVITPSRDELILLENEYLEMISEYPLNSFTVQLISDLAHLQAFYLNKMDDAISWLNKAIALPGIPGELMAKCKTELGDILLFKGDTWEASLLFSQVEKAFKNDVAGHEAKFRNARLYFFMGEFNYAKAQLDILKAATSKLIANDALELSLIISDNFDPDSTTIGLQYFASASLLLYRNRFDEALITLDSINTLGTWHPLFDDVLLKKADIMMKTGKYHSADSLLRKLIQFYPEEITADDALFKLATLHENQFSDKQEAMKLYQQLITDYPGSIYVVEARKRFRLLRGDKIN